MQADEKYDNLMSMNPPDNNSSIAQPSELATQNLAGLQSSAESKGNSRVSTAGGLRTPASQGTPADPTDAGGASLG